MIASENRYTLFRIMLYSPRGMEEPRSGHNGAAALLT
jgi:hypothetical protein